MEIIDGFQIPISTHPDITHIHTTYLDNLENLSADYLDKIEKLKQENPAAYAPPPAEVGRVGLPVPHPLAEQVTLCDFVRRTSHFAQFTHLEPLVNTLTDFAHWQKAKL